MEGHHREQDDKRTDIEYLADVLAEAMREGFSDLGDRIAQGTNPENVAMSLKAISESLSEICGELEEKG